MMIHEGNIFLSLREGPKLRHLYFSNLTEIISVSFFRVVLTLGFPMKLLNRIRGKRLE